MREWHGYLCYARRPSRVLIIVVFRAITYETNGQNSTNRKGAALGQTVRPLSVTDWSGGALSSMCAKAYWSRRSRCFECAADKEVASDKGAFWLLSLQTESCAGAAWDEFVSTQNTNTQRQKVSKNQTQIWSSSPVLLLKIGSTSSGSFLAYFYFR
jgi:hypothetical protein